MASADQVKTGVKRAAASMNVLESYHDGVSFVASAIEAEWKRQKALFESNGSVSPGGVATRALATRGPAGYTSDLKSLLLIQMVHRNKMLLESNGELVEQLHALTKEHMALQFEYDKVLDNAHARLDALEVSGVIQLAQEQVDKEWEVLRPDDWDEKHPDTLPERPVSAGNGNRNQDESAMRNSNSVDASGPRSGASDTVGRDKDAATTSLER